MGLCNMELKFGGYGPEDVHGSFAYGYGSRVLVINEKFGDHEANVAQYGAVQRSFPATKESNNWAAPWSELTSYRKAVIGSDIKPGKMDGWFSDQTQLQEIVGLDKIDTSECVSMRTLFYRCQSLTEIVGADDWDTSACIDMASVFHGAYYVTNSVDLLTNHWNTSNVEDFSGILCGQKVFKDLVVSWDMSNAKLARSSFSYMTETETIDISGISCPLLEDAPFMFGVNDKLTTIWTDGTFEVPADCTAANMFSMDLLIVGGQGTTYRGVGKEFARIDNPPDEPGYFTLKP